MKEQILSYLSSENPWREQIHYSQTVTSTNDLLKQRAKQGAPHGTVYLADCQTAGRGRLGRSFLSPPGVGIYLSVLLRPECTPDQLMHLTCAAAAAACDAIEASVGIRPGIKWTNDLVYQKRKLAGILTEMGLRPDQTVDYAIIGIGINCCQKVEDFTEEIQGFAGSLAMVSSKNIDRPKVAAAMVDAFAKMAENLLSQKSEILTTYRADCITLGQEISVVRDDEIRHGTALDIDENGALIVDFGNGIQEAVSSGEVSIRGMYHYL